MKRTSRKLLVIVWVTALAAACNKIPNHANYIPKDAVAIAGINVKGLSKKIAWNVITGSKLFKEMQKRIPEKSNKDAMSQVEKAGIDILNTFYVYVKTDTRFKGGSRITGLIPLTDAAQWENYVKEVFPQAEIKQKNGRKEASLGSDMYVGWNQHLLVIINVMAISDDEDESASQPKLSVSSKMGQDDLSAEMDNAFGVTSENSIMGNPRFTELQSKSHDLMLWLNYEQLMSQYSGNMSQKMGGIALSGSFWKNAAFTVGFDFVQGKITGDMNYFLPDSMLALGKIFGGANADKDMIDRLPSDKLDMALTMHIAPAGIKGSLEKVGFLGLANEGLAPSGLNVDTILNAFTGDMALVMNDFSLTLVKQKEPFMGQMVEHDEQVANVEMAFVMKLNKKENYKTLVDLAAKSGLAKIENGYVQPINEKDSVYLVSTGDYAVVSNKLPYAYAILDGSNKARKIPGAISKDLTTHPWAMFLDMQELFKKIDPGIAHSGHDSLVINESRRLINNISFSGGAFVNDAFDYHMEINFTNTDENSLIELLDYSMKISDADNSKN